MRSRRSGIFVRWIAVIFLLLSIILLTVQLIMFSRSRITYPANMDIADVPIGGLTRDQAASRLLEVYSLPVELHYQDAVIQLDPNVVGFELELESMLAAADITRIGGNEEKEVTSIPLDSRYSEALLRTYLQSEIALRYDQPAIAAQPQVGSVAFEPGKAGTTIAIDQAVFMVENALQSVTRRTIDLPLEEKLPGRTAFENLDILLKQILD